MASLTYCDMTQSKNHSFDARLKLVKHARAHGIRDAMRAFACARNTVRKWLRRFAQHGRAGLADLSRAPRRCPHKTSPAQQRQVLKARRQLPCAGPRRLKDLFGLQASQGAIARIVRQAGLSAKRRTRRKKKNDLRAIKAQYNPFERLQADTKPLYDIAAYWPQMMRHKLPRQQYTIRDVKTGALFIDYADELSSTYATQATRRVLEHLRRFGVKLEPALKLSTDNGSEYGGSERHERTIGFHARIQATGVTHRFLPPRTPNAHADVESSHALIETELFDLERFVSRKMFFAKVRAYQLWFNFARPNYSKGGKTPAQLVIEAGADPRALLLDPLDLDQHLRNLNFSRRPPPPVGHDLPALPASLP